MSTERSLDEINAEKESASVEESVSEAVSREQNRDPGGKFASGFKELPATTPTDAGTEPEAKAPDGFIPIQALDARLAKSEERYNAILEQNRQLMALLAPKAEPKPQTPAPDFFDDPQAAFRHYLGEALTPLQQQYQEMVEGVSSTIAIEKHGLDVVKSAYEALGQHVQQHGPQSPVYQRIMRSKHPYGEMVKWHGEQSTLSKFGSDPEAYINAEVEKRLNERLGQSGNGTTAQAGGMPGNFSAAGGRNAGPRTAPAWSGPRPLSEIMGR